MEYCLMKMLHRGYSNFWNEYAIYFIDVISIDYAFAQNQSTLMTSMLITSVAKLRYSCILLMTIKHVKHKA